MRNTVGVIACADLGRSKYQAIMHGMAVFEELAIDLNRAKGALLFRLAEDRSRVIIHNSVCNYLLDNDPSPETEGYDWDKLVCTKPASTSPRKRTYGGKKTVPRSS